MKNKKEQEKISTLLEDLNLLESYAQELFSFTPLPLFFISPNGVILEANPSVEKITKKNIYEIIGEPVETVLDEKEIKRIIKETLKKGSTQSQEMFLADKENKKIPVNVFSQARRNQKDKIIGCFLGLFDLTEIKNKEELLEESRQVLEIKVAAKTRELQNLADELEIKINERTKELEEKIVELEKINRLMVGREMKMVELKEKLEENEKKIKKLKNNHG